MDSLGLLAARFVCISLNVSVSGSEAKTTSGPDRGPSDGPGGAGGRGSAESSPEEQAATAGTISRPSSRTVRNTRRGRAIRSRTMPPIRSGATAVGAPGGVRTHTVAILSRLPLPVGLRGPGANPASDELGAAGHRERLDPAAHAELGEQGLRVAAHGALGEV